MARPTAGALTTAGYAQAAGSTTKYAKAVGTATVACELAAGTDKTGVVSIAATTPGVPIAAADIASARVEVGTNCLQGPHTSSVHTAGLVYYGITA
jgi:hypothetical protein